jgi:hypothetical protein
VGVWAGHGVDYVVADGGGLSLLAKGKLYSLLYSLALEYANWCLVGNLKAVKYCLPLGVNVNISGAEESLLSDHSGDMIA